MNFTRHGHHYTSIEAYKAAIESEIRVIKRTTKGDTAGFIAAIEKLKGDKPK